MQNKLKKIFLIDAIGALLSSIFLSLTFYKFYEDFGLPKEVFFILAVIPIFYCFNSFTNYFKNVSKLTSKLKIIAFANLAYCLLTISLCIYYSKSITLIGLTYFCLEIIIVVILSIYELQIAKH